MAYDFKNLSVLVVDDDRYMRTLFRTVLQAFRVGRVHLAQDGAEAFVALRDHSIDLAIVDIKMSPLDGIAFTRLVRTAPDSPNPHLPVIIATGYAERERVIEARDAGSHMVLVKPVSVKTVYDRIAYLIENPRPFLKSPTYYGPDNFGYAKSTNALSWASPEAADDKPDIETDELVFR